MEHFWQIFLLGVVEGITEFLPISSTGHLLIAEHWLGARSEVFNILIQVGAVLAVVLLYQARLRDLLLRWREPANFDYLQKLGGAFLLTAVLGVVVSKLGWKLPEELGPVAWALILGAFFIMAVEWSQSRRRATISIPWLVALAVGLAQIVAGIFPGTSRSAATILTAMLLGVARPAATEFAFLLGIPTMIAASAFAYWKQRKMKEGIVLESPLDLAVGFIVATVTAFIVVKWLLRYIQSHTFLAFAWYRLILGVILLLFVTGQLQPDE